MKPMPARSFVPGLAAAAVLCCGCASIVHGPKQTFTVDSTPRGAKVFVDGGYRGETPLSVAGLTRADSHEIRVEKEGFPAKTALIEPSMSPWAMGNLVSFFVVGVAVDLSNGSFYELKPGSWNAVLQAEDHGSRDWRGEIGKLFDDGLIPESERDGRWRRIDAFERLRKDGLLSDAEFEERCRTVATGSGTGTR